MSRPPVLRRLAVLVSAGIALTTAGPLAPPASGTPPPPWTTVASGLDNPRLLSFGPGDALYVAEAGTGGSGPCVASAEGPACFGTSGAISRIRLRDGHTRRVATGLASMAAPDGSSALGPADVQVSGHRFLVTMGLGNDPAVRRSAGMPRSARRLATLVEGRLGTRHTRVVADLGSFEARHDPDGHGPETDPTASLPVRGGVVVVDAAGNDLLRVGRHGRITTLAVFPDRLVPFPSPSGSVAMQAVPTSVVRGPDGAYYVSQLTGFPFPVGAANIYRVVPGHAPTVYASGFTNITDLAWSHGTLYAVQLADDGLAATSGLPTGSLVRVSGGSPTTVVDHLPAPYGVAIRGRSAYVTTCAVCPAGGGVVRVPLR